MKSYGVICCFVALLIGAGPALAAGEAKPKREPSPGLIAARERQAKCSGEWKEMKAAGKMAADMKWPKFWSACNKPLKGTAV
jgi:hypothetical protein